MHSTLHILNIPPPNLHGFSDHARVRSKIRPSRAFLQPLDIQSLIIRRPHFVSHIPHSAWWKAIFRGSKHALSKPLLLPFASRKLSYRNSKDAQRHRRPFVFGVSALTFRLFARYFSQKRNTSFLPIFLTVGCWMWGGDGVVKLREFYKWYNGKATNITKVSDLVSKGLNYRAIILAWIAEVQTIMHGHGLKAQWAHSPGQAKRRPG